MLAFQGGDEEAFVTLYRRYRDRIINFSRRLTGSQAAGEEVAQEAFLRLYAAQSRYRPDSRFSTYIYRIAKNLCINLHNRRERQLVDSGVDTDRQASLAEGADLTLERSQLRRLIDSALAALPVKQAVAFVLCQHQGMSLKEAALVLELSEGATKSLVFRARQSLIERLQPYCSEQVKVRHAMP